jgi:hypothetical protein
MYLKAKHYLLNYEYRYVMGVGSMICVDGGGSIAAANKLR